MLNESRTKVIQKNLTTMCELFAKGTTIAELCRRTDASITTVRARKEILIRAGVRIESEVTSRGWNTKVFRLDEPLGEAKAKVLAKYETKTKTREKKKAAPREGPGKSGREFGWGIESWFFMTTERSSEYVAWCRPWTVEGEREEGRDE